MRFPILAAMLDEADRIRLAAATEAAGRVLSSDSKPLPVFVMAADIGSPELKRQLANIGDKSIMLMQADDPRLADLMKRVNEPVFPVLPPLPDMRRLFEDPPAWNTAILQGQFGQVFGIPIITTPKPKPRRASSWRIRTIEERADKRAKRKAAEKSRRRNRK